MQPGGKRLWDDNDMDAPSNANENPNEFDFLKPGWYLPIHISAHVYVYTYLPMYVLPMYVFFLFFSFSKHPFILLILIPSFLLIDDLLKFHTEVMAMEKGPNASSKMLALVSRIPTGNAKTSQGHTRNRLVNHVFSLKSKHADRFQAAFDKGLPDTIKATGTAPKTWTNLGKKGRAIGFPFLLQALFDDDNVFPTCKHVIAYPMLEEYNSLKAQGGKKTAGSNADKG